MKTRFQIMFVSLLLFSTSSSAFENYFSNVGSPIPPGCATLSQIWALYNFGGEQTIASGTIQLGNIYDEEQDVVAEIWQKGCPDSGRRVIMITLEVIDNNDGFFDQVYVPTVWASDVPGDVNLKKMRPILEPNSHFVTDELRLIPEGESATFFIDTISVFAPAYDDDSWMDPLQYNGAWTLEMEDAVTGIWTAEIPSYGNSLRPNRITFTGRLSGNWVTPGASDQGLVLAFEELVTEISGLLFMSWYTFGDDGELLWLTGADTYDIEGTTQLTFDIELVTNGEFLGSKVANRAVVGTATLIAYDCNDLELTYNLTQIGLGSGTIQLRRLFSLEIQGYVCSDAATRIEHVNDGD